MPRTPRFLLLALAAALATAVVAAAPAGAALPRPPSTRVVPNAGVGGLRLGGPLSPRPRGWSGPRRCATRGAMQACIWTARRDALPPAGQLGIAGPHVFVGAERNRIVLLSVGAGDRDPSTRPLRRWRLAGGVGFGAPLDAFRRAYPDAIAGRLEGQWVLWGPGRRTRTNVRFVGGALNRVEMNACTPSNSCGT